MHGNESSIAEKEQSAESKCCSICVNCSLLINVEDAVRVVGLCVRGITSASYSWLWYKWLLWRQPMVYGFCRGCRRCSCRGYYAPRGRVLFVNGAG